MAPQTHIPVAANVLGLVPQIWTNWRTKKTDGLPASMMFLWAVCGVPFGAYAIIQNFNYPIQVQPQVFMALCLVSWGQVLVYHHHWPAWKGVIVGLVMAVLFAGVEVALILGLRPIYSRGHEAPALAVGIVASILLAAGLLPPYGEIYKRRGRVVGINWVFLSMDWSGAFFSLMALVAQNTFDVLGGVLYIICAVLEIGIFMSHIIWRIRTRHIRKQAKAQGKTFDDIAAEHAAAGTYFAFAERPIHPRLSPSWWWRRLRGQTAAPAGDEEAANKTGPTVVAGAVVAGQDGTTTTSSSGENVWSLMGESKHGNAGPPKEDGTNDEGDVINCGANGDADADDDEDDRQNAECIERAARPDKRASEAKQA
ncbi:Cystinosin/ERS1p repeat protein [Niveomyces insectorum RCEF 264]|uniref:Cystinosin/ERS1p repeat protein n=1 Tax=Niveomyces insectorum RCEF 264 TaxID=1081102 RepID=A0A167TG09_9HYPO|nr:Cystinosin/ERS1p repeat protein [Niveomyces insectorum RCEF 264]